MEWLESDSVSTGVVSKDLVVGPAQDGQAGSGRADRMTLGCFHSHQGQSFEGSLIQQLCRLSEVDKSVPSCWEPIACWAPSAHGALHDLSQMLTQTKVRRPALWNKMEAV